MDVMIISLDYTYIHRIVSFFAFICLSLCTHISECDDDDVLVDNDDDVVDDDVDVDDVVVDAE